MLLKFVPVVEEQMSVKFTGKVNLLSPFNHQYLGHLLFKDGLIIDVRYMQLSGIKAFYQLGVQEFRLVKHQYIVEPEIVAEEDRRIHYPFSVMMKKLDQQLKIFSLVSGQRPPDSLKVMVDPQMISPPLECTQEEFSVLTTLTEWSRVPDIYQHSQLLEHEITSSLITLRKKGLLKIVGMKTV